MLISITGITDTHRRDAEKPNEDALVYNQEKGYAVIADGCSRVRRQDGSYPGSEGVNASHAFVEAAAAILHNNVEGGFPEQRVRLALRAGKDAVGRENAGHALDIVDFMSTTAVLLQLTHCEHRILAAVGSIGDAMGLLISPKSSAALLTRDQLRRWHQFSYAFEDELMRSEGITRKEAHRRRRIFQDTEIRNRKQAVFRDHSVGFGAATGEKEAEDFFEATSFMARPGDRIVLASDAVTVLLGKGEHETIGDYRQLVDLVRSYPNDQECVQAIIARIREQEAVQQARSDDATVILVTVR